MAKTAKNQDREGVFAFGSYKEFLLSKTGSLGERRGLKSSLAKTLRCQPTYISQVLNGSAHLSLEQAESVSRFFGQTKDERHYFLLLVQKDRSGTKVLEQYFEEQLQEILSKRMVLTQRLGKDNSLNLEQRAVYYGSWHYAAVHIALTIPELRTREQISSYLHVPLKRVSIVLEFLLGCGLAKKTAQGYEPGTADIILGNDSELIYKHHTNWRNQAIESLEREELLDLHYSAVVSLSREDVAKIKELLLIAIQRNLEVIRPSKEEELYSLCFDFFRLKR